MSAEAKAVYEGFVACDVSACGTERLCECAHENVDRARRDTEVVCHTPAVRAEGTDGVGLVNEEVELKGQVSMENGE